MKQETLENKMIQARLNIAEHQLKYGYLGIAEKMKLEWGNVVRWQFEREIKAAEKLIVKN